MEAESVLHLLNFLFMIITASAPAYLAFRLRGLNRRLLLLSVGLSVFAFAHSLYHLAEFLGSTDLADNYLLPLSVILLVAYGAYYGRSGA